MLRRDRLLALALVLAPVVGGSGLALAEGGWKNLLVMPRTTTRDQMKTVMRQQSRALGVDCDSCHEQPDMAKDTDKKKIARAMMRLTKEINGKYFKSGADETVTCWTCHRGKEKPESAASP